MIKNKAIMQFTLINLNFRLIINYLLHNNIRLRLYRLHIPQLTGITLERYSIVKSLNKQTDCISLVGKDPGDQIGDSILAR